MNKKFKKRYWIIQKNYILEIMNGQGHTEYLYNNMSKYFTKEERKSLKTLEDVDNIMYEKSYIKGSYNTLPHISFYEVSCYDFNKEKKYIKDFLYTLIDEDANNYNVLVYIYSEKYISIMKENEMSMTIGEFLS